MPSLLKRGLVLSFSRFSNQAIVLLSPVLLVRILPVSEYGSYREFMLYAGLIGYLGTFGIARSLPYLIPKYPHREQEWLTQTAIFLFASSTVLVIGLHVFGNLIRANISFDFVTGLQLYLLFWINLDFLEGYWLARKRTDYVLYLSTGRLVTRLTVVLVAAYLTQDVGVIIYALVALEAIRCVLVLLYGISRRWFTRHITRGGAKLQGSYFVPLGMGGVIELINRRAGMLFISTMLGAEALAFFAIGALATQVVNIFRGAVSDVIFPELAGMKTAAPKDALPLWQRATTLFCIMLFPIAIIFSYYSDVVVTVLFTDSYAPAIPVFSAFALLLIVDCFDYHLPLRVQNANRYFVSGNLISLIANLILIFPAYVAFGLVGPALALIGSRIVFTLYLAWAASNVYAVNWRNMINWHDVGKITMATLVCTPILFLGKVAISGLFLRGLIFGFLYLAAYLWLLRWLGVWDFSDMLRQMWAQLRLKSTGWGKSK